MNRMEEQCTSVRSVDLDTRISKQHKNVKSIVQNTEAAHLR